MPHELKSFPILQDLPDENCDISECDYLILYNEMCQLSYLVNHFFPNDQFVITKSCTNERVNPRKINKVFIVCFLSKQLE